MPDDSVLTTGPAPIRPAYATIANWCLISGLGRRVVYDLIGQRHLRAVKRGTSTLIDVSHGLQYLASLPPAKIKPITRRHNGDAA